MKHIHAKLIKAWADGAEIEVYSVGVNWETIYSPRWDSVAKYRIKPTPVPNVVKCVYLRYNLSTNQISPPNLKITFDGESLHLIAVELIK